MKYRIANVIMEYTPFGETLTAQSKAYQVEDEQETDIKISFMEGFIEAKQKECPHLSISDIEYIYAGSQFYNQLLAFNGFMLHSSAVAVDGNAYLFSAASGTGKSSHTGLWQELFGERASIINDDKPAIRIEDGDCYVYGTPFSGKTDKNLNVKVPLKGICILERGMENKVQRISDKEAIFYILDQTIRPRDEKMMEQLIEILSQVLEVTPVYRMQCNISLEAAQLAYDTMKGEEQ